MIFIIKGFWTIVLIFVISQNVVEMTIKMKTIVWKASADKNLMSYKKRLFLSLSLCHFMAWLQPIYHKE